jgi:excinuclease ABC subunit B
MVLKMLMFYQAATMNKMDKFKLATEYQPMGDQPSAIAQLVNGLEKGEREQTLLGVTGSGKTFTMANIIAHQNVPTLVLAHNKTLAAQLYSEFKSFFPENEVHYFVSYFDYYQPEAYIASSDTYIEKDSKINDEIDRLRHAATTALLTRRDTIIVASVSCIYGIGSPDAYAEMSIHVKKGERRQQDKFIRLLTDIQYQRNDVDFHRGTFRSKGDVVDVFPAGSDVAYRIEFFGDEVDRITRIDPLTGEILGEPDELKIFPSSHYVTPKQKLEVAIERIKQEFNERMEWFEKHDKLLEAQRLAQRTKYDIEMLEETGFVKGIENYSRYLTNREPGEQPATLIDYFSDDWLLLVDESHMSLPQVRGMYNGDRARKEVLVEHGFRLPSALDNRPLKFEEFDKHINNAIYVSATPGEYELAHSPEPAQQVIRPTGLLDPKIEVRPTKGQVDDLIAEIRDRTARGQRVLVTTLTKRMAEDLSQHLLDLEIKTAYIHSEVDTLERGDILRDLRSGVFDVLVGINLLREGLDLPEVSLVAIIDADKEGFLRSESALIQTIGRAARHEEGAVIMYGDTITRSMQAAIDETNRRRSIQEAYNTEHGITPTSIAKAIDEGLRAIIPKKDDGKPKLDLRKIPKDEYATLIRDLTSQMELASANLEFEKAAELRDLIADIRAKS